MQASPSGGLVLDSAAARGRSPEYDTIGVSYYDDATSLA